MLINLTPKVRVRISRPLWLEIDRTPQLELQLPRPLPKILMPQVPQGYCLRNFISSDAVSLINLFQRAGFPFSTHQLQEALSICLPNGCFVIQHEPSGSLVATMMARHFSSVEHPFGGRIDWLATDPEHRNRRLGDICARSATQQLIQSGYENIWVTTDDQRLGALKIFLSIGFQPIISVETQIRWTEIHRKLGLSAATPSL